jgi:hypothetical protein
MFVFLREGILAPPARGIVVRRALVCLHVTAYSAHSLAPVLDSVRNLRIQYDGDTMAIRLTCSGSVSISRNTEAKPSEPSCQRPILAIFLSSFILILFFFFFLILNSSYLFPWCALYLICFCWRGHDEWRLNAGNEAYEILNLHYRTSFVIYNPSWGLLACRGEV